MGRIVLIGAILLVFAVSALFFGKQVIARSLTEVAQCIADCGAEQGICIGQCQGDPQCISRCQAAHGRCVARCHR